MIKVDERLHGFRLLRKQNVAEADSEAFEFVHEKTGARLFYLKNKDDNKVFSIAFRTPPKDDTGVAHIVEHSTLCGSRKYPLKEPFVELVKGSLNTFLNAMTYPDKTVYPVASRNDKDFQNLMDVYLDAVFYPAMYQTPEILMQEGWHYEIESPEEPLRYSGVVYNEMKGALSSAEDLLGRQIMHSLFPDTAYGYESGGDPEAIPGLSQEMFLEFHHRYYHPSNSYIYLYGDLDIDEKLAYLDEEYLSHFERLEIDSEIRRQKLFAEMKRITDFYPIGSEEEVKEKTFLSLNFLTGDALDTKTLLGLEILEHALLRSPAAPLRKAIVDAELGKDVDSSFETEMLQPMFSMIVNGSEEDRTEEFYNLVMAKLKELRDRGIDKKLLQASLNLFEFRLREDDFGSAPKGLIYGLRSLRSWLYGGDPAESLRYEDILQQLKEGLDQGYFEELVDRYFLQNLHRTLLVFKPSRTMAAEREAEQEKLLAEKKASLSKEEIRQIIENTKKLKERQQAPETPEALATIPILKLSDIRKESDVLPLEERVLQDTKVLFSELETKGIIYLNLYFDASRVPQEQLPYAYLVADLLGNVDTELHSYEDLANEVNLSIGGVSVSLGAYVKNGEPDSFLPKLKVQLKALVSKKTELCSLIAEVLTQTKFTNRKRIKELIEQEAVGFEMSLQRSAHSIVASRLSGYLSKAGRYNDAGNVDYYRFLKDFLSDFDENYAKMQTVFRELLPKLLNRRGLLVGITSTQAVYDELCGELSAVLGKLPQQEYPEQDYSYDCVARNEGLLSSSRVQYVGKAANYVKLGYSYTGALQVLETILRYEYFWTQIRVQGGAYGAFTNFQRSGFMYFGSYRDPRLSETLDVFNGTAEFLRTFEIPDREMDKYIIGTMSHVDAPLTPKMKGCAAVDCYIRNVSYADRQRSRDQILSTGQEDIRALADLVDACMKQNCLCVFGNEEMLKEKKQLFGSLVSVVE